MSKTNVLDNIIVDNTDNTITFDKPLKKNKKVYVNYKYKKANKNISRRATWLDNELTERIYKINKNYPLLGKVWIVTNEYQWVKCAHCKKKQYAKVTTIIKIFDSDNIKRENHINYNRSLKWLKNLRISFLNIGLIGEENEVIKSIKEEFLNKKWTLQVFNKTIGKSL